MNVLESMTFVQEAKKLKKQKHYYVYCRSGQRSIKACTLLEDSGIIVTFNLIEGMNGWSGKTVAPVL